jgi:hypothetical protein
MNDTVLPDEADDSPTARRRSRPWLPMALALVVVLAISVTSWALVSSGQSAKRAEQAALTAAQISRDSAAATATRVASEKAAADKATAAAREKATVAAAVKKALADKERADAKKKTTTSAPRVIVRGSSDYSGGAYGTFGLTALASPGPIHVYESPTDTSRKLYPVYAYENVTVYCSVRAQSINGHNYWDWNGDGWIWDKMVDMNGHSPPPCGD